MTRPSAFSATYPKLLPLWPVAAKAHLFDAAGGQRLN
jgi:hypothetical protein